MGYYHNTNMSSSKSTVGGPGDAFALLAAAAVFASEAHTTPKAQAATSGNSFKSSQPVVNAPLQSVAHAPPSPSQLPPPQPQQIVYPYAKSPPMVPMVPPMHVPSPMSHPQGKSQNQSQGYQNGNKNKVVPIPTGNRTTHQNKVTKSNNAGTFSPPPPNHLQQQQRYTPPHHQFMPQPQSRSAHPPQKHPQVGGGPFEYTAGQHRGPFTPQQFRQGNIHHTGLSPGSTGPSMNASSLDVSENRRRPNGAALQPPSLPHNSAGRRQPRSAEKRRIPSVSSESSIASRSGKHDKPLARSGSRSSQLDDQLDSGRGNYKCGRCGMMKANHICPSLAYPKKDGGCQTEGLERISAISGMRVLAVGKYMPTGIHHDDGMKREVKTKMITPRVPMSKLPIEQTGSAHNGRNVVYNHPQKQNFPLSAVSSTIRSNATGFKRTHAGISSTQPSAKSDDFSDRQPPPYYRSGSFGNRDKAVVEKSSFEDGSVVGHGHMPRMQLVNCNPHMSSSNIMAHKGASLKAHAHQRPSKSSDYMITPSN